MGSSRLRRTPRRILYLEGLAQFPDVSEKLGGWGSCSRAYPPVSTETRQAAGRAAAVPAACTPRPLAHLSPRQHAQPSVTEKAKRPSRGPPAGSSALLVSSATGRTPPLDSSVDSRSASARLSTMVFRLASSSESLSSPSDTSTQPRRPSVKWDLGSDYEAVTKETTASSSDFRRERLDSQLDFGLYSQPQINFLRPRSPIPKLLFRCGSGVQSSCQTRDP